MVIFDEFHVLEEHDVDRLLHEAYVRPSRDIRDALIDLQVDQNGSWVGHSKANMIWHHIIRDAA